MCYHGLATGQVDGEYFLFVVRFLLPILLLNSLLLFFRLLLLLVFLRFRLDLTLRLIFNIFLLDLCVLIFLVLKIQLFKFGSAPVSAVVGILLDQIAIVPEHFD